MAEPSTLHPSGARHTHSKIRGTRPELPEESKLVTILVK